MKILDNLNKELMSEEIDTSKGRLVPDKILVKHHEEVPEIQEQGYRFPTRFYFLNGEIYDTVDEHDKHVDSEGNFVDVDDEFNMKSNEVVFIMSRYIVTQPYCEAVPAWNEYEQIQRYIPYSEEELKEIEEQKQVRLKQEQEEAQQQELLTNLPTLLEEKDKEIKKYADIVKQQQADINDIILTLSEFIGVGDSTASEDVATEDLTDVDTIEEPIENLIDPDNPIKREDDDKDVSDIPVGEEAVKNPVIEDSQVTSNEDNVVENETVENDEDSVIEEPAAEGTGKKE